MVFKNLCNLVPWTKVTASHHGLSQDLETRCPNEGFIDFWVSKVWYKVHTTDEINHIYLHRFCFVRPETALNV